MAQLPIDLYQGIAEDYDSARESMAAGIDDLDNALDRVVNITTATYTDAAAIELALLGPANASLSTYTDLSNTTSVFNSLVRAINNYVLSNNAITAAVIQAAAIASGAASWDALTYYVNVTCTWSCVPYYWERLSNAAGYNTTNWNVCSIS